MYNGQNDDGTVRGSALKRLVRVNSLDRKAGPLRAPRLGIAHTREGAVMPAAPRNPLPTVAGLAGGLHVTVDSLVLQSCRDGILFPRLFLTHTRPPYGRSVFLLPRARISECQWPALDRHVPVGVWRVGARDRYPRRHFGVYLDAAPYPSPPPPPFRTPRSRLASAPLQDVGVSSHHRSYMHNRQDVFQIN